jgi:uncharacterized protein
VPEYFVYCRDRPGTAELREQLVEAHWSFMDGYAERMTARGPTLAEDGLTATGSLHIVDLPDAEAARVFAFEEPNYRAGVYSEVLIRRWQNALGRTMWQFPGEQAGIHQVVLAHGPEADLASIVSQRTERLILRGPLLSDDGSERLGDTLALEGVSRAEIEALLSGGAYDRLEIHPWQFGGRR